MKKLIALLLAVMMVFSLVACGGTTETTAEAETTTTTEETTPAAETETEAASTEETAEPVAVNEEAIGSGIVEGTVLRYRVPGDPGNATVLGGSSPEMATNTTRNVYEGLTGFYLGDTTQIIPALATDWTISDDGLVYTFNIRQGVKFHDGSDLDVNDIVDSYNYLCTLETAAANFTKIVSFEATGDWEITVTLSAPWAEALYYFGNDTFMVMPSEVIAEYGCTFDNCIGTGPYYFNKDLYETDVKSVLTAFADYWGGAPQIETIESVTVANADTALLALQEGEIDVLTDLTEVQAMQVETMEGIDLNYITSTNTSCLYFNTTDSLFSNANVRLALSYLIDREQVALAAYGSLATAADDFFVSNYPAYVGPDGQEYPYEYNPEKGLALLEQEGIDPETLTFTVLRMEENKASGALTNIQSQLAEYGITVEAEVYEFMTFLGMAMGSDYQVMLFEMNNVSVTNPGAAFTSNILTGAFDDFCLEAGMPELYAQIKANYDASTLALETADRDAALKENVKLMNANTLGIPLYNFVNPVGTNSKYSGYYWTTLNSYYYWTVNQ